MEDRNLEKNYLIFQIFQTVKSIKFVKTFNALEDKLFGPKSLIPSSRVKPITNPSLIQTSGSVKPGGIEGENFKLRR